MKTKKPKLLMNGHTDEIYTPKYAIYPLLSYLKRDTIIWECAYGTGALAKHFKSLGYEVVGNGENFFDTNLNCDIIITNPPYSLKEQFLKRAYEINKPFAFLLPLTGLEGKERGKLYRKYGIQLIIPDCRIDFITPNHGKSAWFAVAWFTYKFNLPKDLMFIELSEYKKQYKNELH